MTTELPRVARTRRLPVRALLALLVAVLVGVAAQLPTDDAVGLAVTGNVSRAFGPAPGVSAKVVDRMYGTVIASTTTDASRNYFVSLPTAKDVKVEVSDATGVYRKTYNGNVATFTAAPTVHLTTASVTADVTVTANSVATVDQALPVAAHVTGKATAGGTFAVAGMYVLIGAAFSAPHDTYTIGNIPAGPCKMALIDPAIQPTPALTLRPEFYANVDVLSFPNLDAGFLDATPGVVGEGATVTTDQTLTGVACPTFDATNPSVSVTGPTSVERGPAVMVVDASDAGSGLATVAVTA